MTGTASDKVLERLSRLHPKLIDLELDRVEALLERLGHPERKLAPVVHIAGTNGKGSTLAFLRACLEAAGRKVQVYTSPHMVRFHERIRLIDGLIDEADLVDLLERLETANDGRAITYFEITTVAAFAAFAAEQADVTLLETGLGGRMDATNMIDRPRLNIITPIDHDHAQFLGDTIASIAYEKAGILKPGVLAVIAPQRPEALAVIEARAAEIGAPLLRHGQEWTFQPDDTRVEAGFEVTLKGQSRRLPAPSLLGSHQILNAAVAVVAALTLGDLAPDEAALQKGVASAVWAGRLQKLDEGPLADRAAKRDGGWELWLDGGHNPAAGAVLSTVLENWSDRPLHLICAMMNSKEAGGFLRPLASHVASCRCLTIPDEANAFDADDLAAIARAAGLVDAQACASLPEALRDILDHEPAGRILICGSVYFAGRVLDHGRWP